MYVLHSYSGYAIPAVNCVSNSGINACLEAARKNDAPIIIQFSSGGSQVSVLLFIDTCYIYFGILMTITQTPN